MAIEKNRVQYASQANSSILHSPFFWLLPFSPVQPGARLYLFPPIPRAAPLKKAATEHNKFKQAFILASELIQAPCSAEYYWQTLELTADILMAKQDRTNAFYFYQEALDLFEVIFIPDSIDTAAMIAPQLRYHGIDQVLLMGTNLWHSDKLLSYTHEFQDAVFTDEFDPETPDARQFISRFEEGTGKRPSYMEAAAFDTTLALIRVLSENQITSRSHLTEILGNVHLLFLPLSCPMAFDPQGESESLLHLFQVQKNEVVIIQSCSQLKDSSTIIQ